LAVLDGGHDAHNMAYRRFVKLNGISVCLGHVFISLTDSLVPENKSAALLYLSMGG